MEKVLIALLSTNFLISCDVDTKNNKVQTEKVQTEENITVPDEDFVLSPIDSSKNILIHSRLFIGVIMDKSIESDSNSFTPIVPEIIQAEEVLNKCLYTDKIDTDGIDINVNELREPNKYIRQYFGRINEKGQRTIYINCLHLKITQYLSDTGQGRRWERGKVSFEDGGNNFFDVLINLDTKSCSGFSINGLA